jgi:hypothetical protein
VTSRQVPGIRSASDLSDEELDRFILTRLAIVGVDLSVLPVDDPEAPVDQARVLRSARSFLRNTVPEISGLELVLYPASLAPHLERARDAP